MSILCGWASQSEKGTINGKKGDQTGKEVKIGNYVTIGQNCVIVKDIADNQTVVSNDRLRIL